MIRLLPAFAEQLEEIYSIEQENPFDAWSERSLREEFENHFILTALEGDLRTLAYASMRHVINEGHIVKIAVAKAFQRQGIGTLLLRGLADEARRLGMIGLTLEVRAGNLAAIAMYEKFGFTVEGRQKNYYSCPDEDGVIMWKEIGGAWRRGPIK